MASGERQSNPSTSGDAGGDHNEDYGDEYGPPLPTQEELREMEHRRLVDKATNTMLNVAKDPNLAKYMTETTFQDVHADRKATTTSPPKKKQYSEKKLEEENVWQSFFRVIMFTVNDNEDVNMVGGGYHWSLLVYHRDLNKFEHYDSMGGMNARHAKKLASTFRPFLGPDAVSANFEEAWTPHQVNGHDCGVYVMAVAQVSE
ncbi:hypothetical protein L7F22_022810 [Adiantum nelumboides]|nr:hypothetical protein [Adiantum nelumboides]